MARRNEGRKQHRLSSRALYTALGDAGPGVSPDTPVYIGDREPTQAVYSLFQYNDKEISIMTPEDVGELVTLLDPERVNWININGLADQQAIKQLCSFFHLESLSIEDILNTEHRVKIEDFGDYVLMIMKMISPTTNGELEYEQISFILAGNTIISIQETPGDFFSPVRERLKTRTGRLRKRGANWLFHALLDVIIDTYFIALESLDPRIDAIEDVTLSKNHGKELMKDIQVLKMQLNRMRRIIAPLRELTIGLTHIEISFFEEAQIPFFRDLHENVMQILESLDNSRETIAGLQEIYLATLSNRMNEVMKVLTIISTIFIPLTFIAGVYGMNFPWMPGLDSPLGFPLVMLSMAASSVAMLVFFKFKKWL